MYFIYIMKIKTINFERLTKSIKIIRFIKIDCLNARILLIIIQDCI